MTTQTDPVAIVRAYDAAWNDHDVDKIVDFFADDAVVQVEPAPPPPLPAVSTGKAAIRAFVQALVDGFAVSSTDHAVVGGRVTWRSTVKSDAFRALGLEEALCRCEAALRDGRLTRFHVEFAPQTVAEIQSAMARAASR